MLDWIPWQWWAGGGMTAALALAGVVYWYTGSLRITLAVLAAGAVAVLTLGSYRKGRDEGKAREVAAAKKAAQKRADTRGKVIEKVDRLKDKDVDARLNKWSRP